MCVVCQTSCLHFGSCDKRFLLCRFCFICDVQWIFESNPLFLVGGTMNNIEGRGTSGTKPTNGTLFCADVFTINRALTRRTWVPCFLVRRFLTGWTRTRGTVPPAKRPIKVCCLYKMIVLVIVYCVRGFGSAGSRTDFSRCVHARGWGKRRIQYLLFGFCQRQLMHYIVKLYALLVA